MLYEVITSFQQRQKVADSLEQLERADLIRFIRSLRSSRADRIIVCSYGEAHRQETRIEQGYFIRDLNAFRLSSRKFYNL